MTRNLDHRIEVVVPVEQTRLRQEIDRDLRQRCSPTRRPPGSSPADGDLDAAEPRQGRARAQPSAQPAATCARAHAQGGRQPGAGEQARASDRGARENDGHEGRSDRRGLEHGAPARRVVAATTSAACARSGSILGSVRRSCSTERVRRSKLDEVREVTAEYARIARKLGVRELETVVTAPGTAGRLAGPPARRDRAGDGR